MQNPTLKGDNTAYIAIVWGYYPYPYLFNDYSRAGGCISSAKIFMQVQGVKMHLFKQLTKRAFLLVLAISAGLGQCRIAAAKDILEWIPADCCGFMVIPNAGKLGTDLKEFVAPIELALIPADPLAMLCLRSGIDFTGDQGAAFVFPSDEVTGVISKYYTDTLDGAIIPSSPDGVAILTGINLKSIWSSKLTDQGDGKFLIENVENISCARQVGDDAFLSTSQELIDAVINANKSVVDVYDNKRLAVIRDSSVSITINYRNLIPAFKMASEKKIEKQIVATQADADGVIRAKCGLKIAEDTCSQIDSIDVAVSFSAKGLQVDWYLNAVPSSAIANFLNAIKPTRPLFAGLPAGDMACCYAINLGEADYYRPFVADLVSYMEMSLADYPVSRSDKDPLAAVRQLPEKISKIPYVFATALYADLNSDPRTCVGVNVSDSIESSISVIELLGKEGAEFVHKPSVATADGLDIDSLSFINTALGDLDTMYVAKLPNGDIGYVSGSPENISLAITGMDNGLQKSALIEKTLAVMPDNTCAAFLLSPRNLGKTMGFMPWATSPEFVSPPECEDPIVMAFGFGNGGSHGRMIVPAALLRDVARIYMQVMMLQSYQNKPIPHTQGQF